MAHIRPFHAIRYARRPDLDLSKLIAPPYDVLDEKSKAAYVARHPNNIVSVDLPWLPPKSVGPDSAYQNANITLQSWLKTGILTQDKRPATYPYMQTFEHSGRTYHRRGFISLVRLSPFGQGQVVPHEKTYEAPIEDRLKLMRATKAQLSPIFGLYSDPRHEVNNALYANVGKPEHAGDLDGVKHQLWSVTDAEVENRVSDLMGNKPIYIADGHHRYTTALAYQKEVAAQYQAEHGSPLPPSHPANWCLFVLVGMQDDGMLILPTHRILGNVPKFDIATFTRVVSPNFEVTETPLPPDQVDEFVRNILPMQPAHTFGLYDGRAKKLYQLACKNPDVLKNLEPGQSEPWRRLDVAILQRYFLDEVVTPLFGEPTKSYTAYADQVVPMTDGAKNQVAILLKSTPLAALEQLGRHGEVMPQKSTFFYPKLATGMAINPL
ncbi:DUF1015 domain-containing protein [Humisphaera borealis]|uniref:DUF1015 domain-containing protein n=1 Tax=Humisphaera borealis TaxID=2807512 RepID=A0A7M2X2W4_9BACT|nr:DUF1015 domain-containing protein [Humisphaera borealis]QOV91100.1 DUF1015 domain-containing protein [Humisphaera borealis]